MANTRELRRRIKSVKNTAQITKAMQMVAATKMKRAQNQALSGRPYSDTLSQSLANLLPNIQSEHALLAPNGVTQKSLVVLSTNKALCGALNSNLFRGISASHLSSGNVKFFSVGLKAKNFVIQNNFTLEGDFENTEVVMFNRAKKIADLVIQAYLEKVIGEVYLAYPHFVSTLRQEPRIVKLLPISEDHLRGEGSLISNAHLGGVGLVSEFLFEPNADQLLDFVLTHQVETQIYQALLETKASENSARMMAMQNATDNAKDLVESLNLTYNKTRQDAITAELLEITSAGLALE